MCRSEQVFSPPRCVPGSTSCLPRHTTTATSDVVPVCAVRVAKHAGPCHKSYLSLNTRFGVVLAERERCVCREGAVTLTPLLHFLSSTPSHSLAGWPAGRLINNIKKSYPAAAPALKKSLRGGGRWLGWIGCRGVGQAVPEAAGLIMRAQKSGGAYVKSLGSDSTTVCAHACV